MELVFNKPGVKGDHLASFTNDDGFVVSVYGGIEESEFIGFGRVGRIFIIDPSGQEVKGPYWMDYIHPGFAMSKHEYDSLDKESRAHLKCVQMSSTFELAYLFKFYSQDKIN